MSSSQHCEDDITQCDPCDAGQVAVIIPFLDGGMKAKHLLSLSWSLITYTISQELSFL